MLRALAGRAAFALLFLASVASLASAGTRMTVTRYAGAAGAGWQDGVGSEARFCLPTGVAADRAGFVYVADSGNGTIRRISPDGRVTTLAGLAGNRGFSDGFGAAARFYGPTDLTIDPSGVLFVTDRGNSAIRRIGVDGHVTIWAHLPDASPTRIVRGADGTLYVLDSRARVVRVVGTDRSVRLLQLRRASGSPLREIVALSVGFGGRIFVLEEGGHEVLRADADGLLREFARLGDDYVSRGAGIVSEADGSLVVCTGWNAYRISPDGTRRILWWGGDDDRDGPLETASFQEISGITTDGSGGLVLAERCGTIRRVGADGFVRTVAGIPAERRRRDGPLEDSAFGEVGALAFTPEGELLVGDWNLRTIDRDGRVRTLVRDQMASVAATKDGIFAILSWPRWREGFPCAIYRVAGDRLVRFAGSETRSGAVDGNLEDARFEEILAIAAARNGDLFVLERVGTVRIVSGGKVRTLAGMAKDLRYVDGPPGVGRLLQPTSIAVDRDGTLLVGDAARIRRVSLDGSISTVAGSWAGHTDGPPAQARFGENLKASVDRFGNLFVLDPGNQAIRRRPPDGDFETVVGGPRPDGTRLGGGVYPDWGQWSVEGTSLDASVASFSCLTIDDSGRLFLGDGGRIWQASYGLADAVGSSAPFCSADSITLDLSPWSGGSVEWRFTRIPSNSSAALACDGPTATFLPDVSDVFEVEARTSTGVEASVTRVRAGRPFVTVTRWNPDPPCLYGGISVSAFTSPGARRIWWSRNGVELEGETSASFIAIAAPDVEYRAAADFGCEVAVSDPIRLEYVEGSPEMPDLPPSFDVELGKRFDVSVQPTGGSAGVWTVHWTDPSVWSRGEGPTLSIPSVQPSDLGRWTCEVRNACGAVYAYFELRVH